MKGVEDVEERLRFDRSNKNPFSCTFPRFILRILLQFSFKLSAYENSAVIKIGAIEVYCHHYYYDLFYFYDVVHFIFHEDLRRKRKSKMPVLCFNP